MAITAIRTAIIYVFLIAALRVTGKRQLGELQPIELVVTLLISDLASVPMQESGAPLLTGLIPIAVLVALELILSAIMMKSHGVARLISGNPIVIIRNGEVSVRALRRLRMTMEDLLETLRQQDVFDLRDVQYAIAETSGKISVFKAKNPPQTAAVPLVSDGKTVDWALQMTGIPLKWVHKTLARHDCDLHDTLLLAADSKRQYYLIRKGEKSV
ncbi:MAG: DUF421 domain-containing protein [Clostridia bacterium]|nr:DUF421 domain-containing protein [Clostridia bacterium]